MTKFKSLIYFSMMLFAASVANHSDAASTSRSYSSGFSSSRSSTSGFSSTTSRATQSTSTTPAPAPVKSSFGSFGSQAEKSSPASSKSIPTQSDSALSNTLEKSAAQKNAQESMALREQRNAQQAETTGPVLSKSNNNSQPSSATNQTVSSGVYGNAIGSNVPTQQVVVVNQSQQASSNHFWTGAALGYIFGSHHTEPQRHDYPSVRQESYSSGPAFPSTSGTTENSPQEDGSVMTFLLWMCGLGLLITVCWFFIRLKSKKYSPRYKL